jgi:hypothetical protein
MRAVRETVQDLLRAYLTRSIRRGGNCGNFLGSQRDVDVACVGISWCWLGVCPCRSGRDSESPTRGWGWLDYQLGGLGVVFLVQLGGVPPR